MLFTGHTAAGLARSDSRRVVWRGSTTVRICHSRRVRLLSYNVNYGNREPRASLDAIAEADADVVLLQEITARWQAALADRFAADYPVHVYRLHGRNAGGLAVLSKLPVGGEELYPP